MVVTSFLMMSASQAELVYLAKVNFAGKIFTDIIILEHPIGEKQNINGSLTVPGVFNTKFLGHQVFDNPTISFNTTAIENGNTLNIRGYLKSVEPYERLTGFLDVYIGDSKNKVTAPLTAVLIHRDQK